MEQLKQEVYSESFWRALPAEFLGTAVLVFCGVASALGWAGQQPDTLQVALGFGLAVSAASLCTQGVGAGHLNPAVSLALLLGLRISPLRALLSILMQGLGAIAACALLYVLTPPGVRGELGLSKIRFTGCSMNPARSLGPAVITSNFSQHWIFWVGPLLGGALAVIVYSFLLSPKKTRCGECLSALKTDTKLEHKVESQP
ncbi:aquaporin-5-like isoform X2 [Mobula birostris]|uniref:aquaporin-5-like isoform X2 n=1 Tax=Mobula birostris TaxID=1983395 RepID=UPI003B28063F